MREHYIGIENELATFRKEERIPFESAQFEKLKNSFEEAYLKSEKSIRTSSGHGFYIDGRELEILTPPIRINRGFASRLTDSIICGRNAVFDATENSNSHTGYSMHWNLTKTKVPDNFFNNLAIPFYLFGLTPISFGIKMREKPNRFELLGDHIQDEDQIRATALLLGAYHQMSSQQHAPPFRVLEVSPNSRFLPDGRYSQIHIEDMRENGLLTQIQAQQYLESFYHWLSPAIEALGNPEEIENLADFVHFRKKLTLDNFEYFSHLQDYGLKEGGYYAPHKKKIGKIKFNTKLEKVEGKRLPLENLLLGEIVRQDEKSIGINELSWEELKVIQNTNTKTIRGIQNIYRFASKLPNCPKAPRGRTLSLVPGEIISPTEVPPIEYDFKSAKKNLQSTNLSIGGLVLESLKKRTFTDFTIFGALSLALGVGSFIVGVSIGGWYVNINSTLEAERIISGKNIINHQNIEQIPKENSEVENE